KLDHSPPSAKVKKVYGRLSHTEASILTQLRTSHANLNAHLFRIKATASPNCTTCNVPETVSHFLL
ncbi:hypothetical protein IW261DRAFT_1298396, partial [Armillaria novae-zelandiae]